MVLADKHVMIFAIHRTSDWWKYVGSHLGCKQTTVVTDLRDEGEVRIVDDFYFYLEQFKKNKNLAFKLLDEDQLVDIIARCRVLRWLDDSHARNLIKAMACALDKALGQLNPDLILSLPIDRYPTDILDRLAVNRGIPYVQLTASVFNGMSMLLQRGRMLKNNSEPSESTVQEKIEELLAPTFVPSYVPAKNSYTTWKFIKTLGYFRLRASVFKMFGYIKKDRYNLHYLDAQPSLGHKCRWKDIRINRLIMNDWEERIERFSREKRVLFGLQLFPEASIDYWIEPIELIEYEDLLVRAAQKFSDQGFVIIVKDHPLQYGFRKTDFLDRLLEIENVVMVPYQVPGQRMLELVDKNFTFTGTLGLQAALLGKQSFVTESYYTNATDFELFKSGQDIENLSELLQQGYELLEGDALEERRRRLVKPLIQGSFMGDLFSFQGFDASNPSESAAHLGVSLGRMIEQIIE